MAVFGKTPSIDFLGRRRMAVVISALMLVVSIGSIGMRGLNFGIDFTGGVLLEIEYPEAANLPQIRETLGAGGFGDAQVQNFGTARDVLIRVLPRGDTESAKVGESILEVLRAADPGVELLRVEFVGPQVGDELTERGGLAMIFVLLLILAYIMFRFQWKFAVGAVAALVHDVIITIGFFSLAQVSFDLSVLAAILAVIGYSLNDTIVVFDRIRENFRLDHRNDAETIMNTSINQTLSRSVITSGTTVLVVVALLLLGGEAVNGFALALIVGIVVGTYSSIFIASAAALALDVKPLDLMPPKVDDTEVDSLP